MTDSRQEFQTALDVVASEVGEMADIVIASVETATAVLLRLDLDDARTVIERDDSVDALALNLEDRCTKLLALQAPVASDLRAIVSALWIVADFERCGDLAVNVVKAARRLLGISLGDQLSGLLERMGVEAVSLLRLAAKAYAARDASMAAALPDLDDELDRLHRQWLRAIFDAHRSGTLEVEAGVQLALVGRYYERLGDHAVNVGNRIVYLATGWLPEHTGAARQAARNRLRSTEGPTGSAFGAADERDRGADGPQWQGDPPSDEVS